MLMTRRKKQSEAHNKENKECCVTWESKQLSRAAHIFHEGGWNIIAITRVRACAQAVCLFWEKRGVSNQWRGPQKRRGRMDTSSPWLSRPRDRKSTRLKSDLNKVVQIQSFGNRMNRINSKIDKFGKRHGENKTTRLEKRQKNKPVQFSSPGNRMSRTKIRLGYEDTGKRSRICQ